MSSAENGPDAGEALEVIAGVFSRYGAQPSAQLALEHCGRHGA